MSARRPATGPAFVPDAARLRRAAMTGKLGRIGWFVLLWAMSVVSLTLVALPLRWLLKPS